ncbi:hypothetical protein [Armatimonas sp.]|uniref:hypothetical protein n=1 Tax=Armatimonas sp. TaxID=1872638 RepID=UPI003753E31B
MSTQLFDEDAPAVTAPKNGRSVRSTPAPKPEIALTDPFDEEPEGTPGVPEEVSPVAVAEPITPVSDPEPVPLPVALEPVIIPEPAVVPVLRRLPDERQSLTLALKVGGCAGLVIVGLFEDGTPGEVLLLLRSAPAGASVALEAFAATLTLALPYGIPAGVLASQLLALLPEGNAREAAASIAASLSARF